MIFTALNDKVKNKVLTLYSKHLTRKLKKKQIVDPSPQSLHIGLVYTHDAAKPYKTEAISQIVQKLQAEQQYVQILCYVPHPKPTTIHIPFNIITKQEINLLGRSSNTAINTFLHSPFTQLYHLDHESDPILDYIIAKCTARHKIGHYLAGREYLFDIMFKDLSPQEEQEEASFGSIIDKMFHYIKMLKV